MAADDLVLDMIKTHSHYDTPDDTTLSSHDVPECHDFTGASHETHAHTHKEIITTLKRHTHDWTGEQINPDDWTTKISQAPDWTKPKNTNIVEYEQSSLVKTWEGDGRGEDESNEESEGSTFTRHSTGDEDGFTCHKTGEGEEDTTKHTIGREEPTYEHTGDGSQSELRTTAIGRPGVDVDDDWWDGEGRPTGERWPPLGAPDDQAEDGDSFDSW